MRRAGVLRPHTFKPMGQQQNDSAQATPFVFGSRDELVDDGLGRIHKIAELRLPHHETVRTIEAIAVFESEDTVLGQWTVVDIDRRLIGLEVLEWPI